MHGRFIILIILIIIVPHSPFFIPRRPCTRGDDCKSVSVLCITCIYFNHAENEARGVPVSELSKW